MNSVFGPLRQISYVVTDIDEAIERWHHQVGLGPFAAQRQRALEHGFSAVVDVESPGARMSYLESREIEGLIFELIEWNEATRGYFDGVQQFLSQVDPAQLKHEFPI